MHDLGAAHVDEAAMPRHGDAERNAGAGGAAENGAHLQREHPLLGHRGGMSATRADDPCPGGVQHEHGGEDAGRGIAVDPSLGAFASSTVSISLSRGHSPEGPKRSVRILLGL